jgi:transcriptional repressor of cell division inhibition gene dicB
MRKTDAIKFFGTRAEMARALGITKQSITSWGDTVPLARQYQIERLTGGRLKGPAVARYSRQSAA